MKIVIDCRMLKSSGVGVYLKEILRHLYNEPHDFFLIGDSFDSLPNSEQKSEYEKKPFTLIYDSLKPFSLKEIVFGFPYSIKKLINSCDLYYTPFFNIPRGIRIPIFSTIHDVVFPDMPELTSKLGLKLRMWFFRRAIKKSKLVFTVSEFSKERIQHYFGNKKPIVVTYNGVPNYLIHPEQIQHEKQKYDLKVDNVHQVIKKTTMKEEFSFDEPFLLFIGNIKKHKGLPVLLQAMSLCKEQGLTIKLFIVGNGDNFRTKDSSLNLNQENVSFTGYLSEEVLREYIKNAALLVQPSLYEGFGIPPLEAMNLGTPVLVSDIPVFKEIYADFPANFFEAGNAEDLSKKIIQLFSKGIPARLVLTEAQKTKYTYEKTAKIVLDILEKN